MAIVTDSGHYEIADNLNPTGGDLTMCCWMRGTSTSGQAIIMRTIAGNGWHLLRFDGDSTLFVQAYDGGGLVALTGSTSVMTNWTFVSIVIESGVAFSLYVDDMGTADDTDATFGTYQNSTDGTFSLGAYKTGVQYWTGELAEFAMFDRALTEGERITCKHRGPLFLGPELCYLKLHNDDATHRDMSGNGNDFAEEGTLSMANTNPPVGGMPDVGGWWGAYTAPAATNAMPMAIHHYKMAGGL